MSKGFRIRLHHWLMAIGGAIVLGLALAFLATTLRAFQGVAEDNARTQFDLIASQADREVEGLLARNAQFTATQVQADLAQFIRGGHIQTEALTPIFLSSLAADPSLYSHFVALPNEEFFQVIAVRRDPGIVAALQAPAQSYFAVRLIQPTAGGVGRDHYLFLDQAKRSLGAQQRSTTFRPSQRPWYHQSMEHGAISVTAPYLFASTGKPGITISAPLPNRSGVLASDISLSALQDFVAQLTLPPNGAIAVLDGSDRLLAFQGRGTRFAALRPAPMGALADLHAPALALLQRLPQPGAASVQRLGTQGEPFVLTWHPTQAVGGAPLRVVVLAPLSDFTSAFQDAEHRLLLLSAIALLLLPPLAYFATRQVTSALATLAHDSEHLRHLDFSQQPRMPHSFLYEVQALGEAQCVMHTAIQKRTQDLVQSQDKLENLVHTGLEMGREADRMELLRKILFSGKTLLHCDAGTLYLLTERKTLRFALRTLSDELPSFEIPLFDAEGRPNERYMATWCALHNAPVLVDDLYAETRFDVSGAKQFDTQTGYRSVSMLSVPLSPREGEVIGVLQFLNALDPQTGAVIPFQPEQLRFVTAMAAQAAVALDNLQLLQAHKELLDAVIQLLAGAIDAKSAYTGGHCARVPELGLMLAQAACEVQEGPLADFRFQNEDEWREFRIGAWLHDCGKITTPEYVVDKATKLETIYNRIHEVRMRFEVLLRDAQIAQLQALAQGADPAQEQARFEARKAQLLEDFAFVAECNLGGEFMADERVQRLRRIAQQSWQRHFDDRLGLAHDELRRYPATAAPLPVTEALLADQPQHIVPRTATQVLDPKWGFKVRVPTHLYNYGEVYNLAVSRGTLTEEERFKINEHVMQSLMMLEQLPLPKNLQRVPAYAGTHHETLLGTGYPRGLDASQLSVPMRIMAIVDIFEALTASDRPYKKAKTLSESVKILSFFKKDGHIDPDLFDLFLSSGVYLRYAEKFLRPEQIDTVDVARYLGPR